MAEKNKSPKADHPASNILYESELLRCVASNPGNGADAWPVAEFLRHELDWNVILELGARHRILPLLAAALEQLPKSQLERIPVDARRALMHATIQSRRTSASMVEVMQTLLQALGRRNIPLMVVKGLGTAALYPSLSLRPSDDIDLLVREADWVSLTETLTALGFRPHCEFAAVRTLTPAQVVHLASYVTQVKFIAPNGLVIEVHFRLYNIGIPAPVEDAWSRVRFEFISGTPLPTLGREDAILYHAMHANMHQFSRLIWLSDLRLMLHRWAAELDWTWIIQKAREKRIQYSLGYAVQLALNLGPPLPHVPEPSALMAPANARQLRFQRRWQRRNIEALDRTPVRFTGVHYYLQDVASWPDRLRYLRRILFPPRWCLGGVTQWAYLRKRWSQATTTDRSPRRFTTGGNAANSP